MLVLKVKEFIKKIENNELIHELSTTLPRMSSSKEEIAWEESFTQVSILLSSIIDEGNTEFGDVDIILEYHLPLSSKYCDLILAGKKNNRKCCFIMELKNWKKNDSDSPGEIKGTMIHHNNIVVHPSQQVAGYTNYIQNFHSAFSNSKDNKITTGVVFFTSDISLIPYRQGINAKLASDYPLYSLNSVEELKKDILEYIDSGLNGFADEIISGTYKQNRSMLVGFANLLKHYEYENTPLPYVLLDEQNTGYENIIQRLNSVITRNSNKKEVIIIKGNPGSGKSAIAINAWIESILIAKKNDLDPQKNIVFCTTSDAQHKAWTNVVNKSGIAGIDNAIIKASKFNPGINSNNINNLVDVLRDIKPNVLYADGKQHGKIKYRIDPLKWRETLKLFKSGVLEKYGYKYNKIDEFLLVLVDEAHGLMQPVDETKKGKEQIIKIGTKDIPPAVGPMSYHIIDNSKISVFFIDSQQAYRDKESTRETDIERYAKELGANITTIDLEDSEYRCGGSKEYVEWVRNLFESPKLLDSKKWKNDFSLQVVDYPSDMEEILIQHIAEGCSVRYMAYYSVEWKTQNIESNPSKYFLPPDKKDFCLPDKNGKMFSKCWNSKEDYISPRENHEMYKNPLLEVGYPLVVRGFDFDYVGIIWLDDLVYRNGTWYISLDKTKLDKGPSSMRSAAIAEAKKKTGLLSMSKDKEAINKYCRSIFGNYLVLLTRAIKGNVLYIKDKETRDYIKSLLLE